jgi:replicative DNA helicase
VQGLFRLVLIKDYGATRSGGAAKLRQVEQTAPKARDMKELRDKIAKQSVKRREI